METPKKGTKKRIPPLDDMRKTHKSVRYDIRNVRFFKKQKSSIFPYRLRNDMDISLQVI